MKFYLRSSVIVLCLVCILFDSRAQSSKKDTLFERFVSPPASARPRVWWHWMNGNITKDGIGKDLRWMKRIGIGGVQNFDAAWSTPQIVKKRLAFMTPDWKDAFLYTTKLADSLKLEMAIASSPGWSESGGPWVSPADGMKKIVWCETYMEGGKPFLGKLSHPPTATGDFQNLSIYGSDKTGPNFYRDIAVIAYKLSDSDVLLSSLKPKVTSSAGNFNLTQLTDGDIATANALPIDTVNKQAWIQFEFDKPEPFESITIVGGGRDETVNAGKNEGKDRILQVSVDGKNFRLVCYIPKSRVVQQTISFPAVTAKYYRVLFIADKNAPTINVAELVLHSTSRISNFEEKAGFAVGNAMYYSPTPEINNAPELNNIVDLTGKLDETGELNWAPPAGKWVVIRYGYSLIGTTNHPASPEATGFEVDKMDARAVKSYFETYLAMYKKVTGGLMGNKGGLKFLVTDSWEAGAANWTENMPAEFRKRRGYDMLSWMPVISGHIVQSAEDSERFLWDFRKTLSELVAEYHYDQLTTLLHQRGMKRYTESHETGRALIADGMDVKRNADIPMSAMWTPSIWSGPSENYLSDILESASVAHVYGQNLVAAESFTAFGNAWSWTPEKLKPTADLELSAGLNRFVIHTSVHQPVDDKIPGLGLGPFGQWFNRHETWAEQAKPWIDYLSRSSYLLQQGKYVADVAYYYGEDNNITSLFRYKLPDVPDGYKYDFINSDALLNLLSVKNNEIITPGGMTYKVLALDSNSRRMPLNVLKKIKAMVAMGAVVVGPRPLMTAGLADSKTEFNTIANELWGDDKKSSKKVFSNLTIAELLDKIKVTPDFKYTEPNKAVKLLYVHRRAGNKDIYWVNNRTGDVQDIRAQFRVSGKSVEIWHPETGKRELASYNFKKGLTEVPLYLTPNDAIFVVFSCNPTKAFFDIKPPVKRQLKVLNGRWMLSFQKERGAPSSTIIDSLISWDKSTDAGIKYFSGTGTYSNTFDLPAGSIKNSGKIWIDLGEMREIAEVLINGKCAGITWKKPYQAEITKLIKHGKNTIEVKVTNAWVNRLIGDQQPNNKVKYTYTTEKFYDANSPLLISGLLGPVTIFSSK